MNAKPFPGQDSKPGTMTGKEKGFPIGTIRNGRQKTSNNPSKWVELHTGKSYDEHNSTEEGDHQPKSLKHGQEHIIKVLSERIHPDDVAKATALLKDWVDKKHKAKSLQTASNVHSSTSGGALSNAHVGTAGKAFDAANKAKDTLINLLQTSAKRHASEQSTKEG